MRGTYVMRPLVEPERLLSWAWKRGVRWSLEPSDMHVTIIHSEAEVKGLAPDVRAMSLDVRSARLSRMGAGALVLEVFAGAEELHWRNTVLRQYGGVSTFPEYRPHVTLTYKDMRPHVPRIEFRGRLRLGPEKWSPLFEDDGGLHSEVPLRRMSLTQRRATAERLDREEGV